MKDQRRPLPPSRQYVTSLEGRLVPKLQQILEENGWLFSKPPYCHFAAKKEGLTCTVYQSGKVVVQGAGTGEFVEFTLLPLTLEGISWTPHIGSDESGKGDFFGPLAVAAVYVGPEDLLFLQQLGARDSKDLSDAKCLAMASAIQQQLTAHVICLSPKKYNELWSRFGNLNRLMGWAHVEALSAVAAKTQCQEALIDQFADEDVINQIARAKKSTLRISQRTRAESDPAVAAASIVARAAFLQGLKAAEKEAGCPLPKGSSDPSIVSVAVSIAKNHGIESLHAIAKTHFKTFAQVKERL